ncbi:hypothetical protein ACFQ07_25250, partial [Actinomadura adrarensis]
IADVPRHRGEIGRAALVTADTLLFLVPAEVRATMAADALATDLRDQLSDTRLIVTGPAPGGVTPEAVSRALDLPLSGVLQRDRKTATALEEGGIAASMRRGPLADLCKQLVPTLGQEPVTIQAEAA